MPTVRTDKNDLAVFDAIVVGSGASGGLAALKLAESGLKVLVLEGAWQPTPWRAPFRRTVDYSARLLANPAVLPYIPPGLVYKGRRALRLFGSVRQPIQTKCYAWERRPGAFVDDIDNPYTNAEDGAFSWLRARTVGGRVVVPGHGRQYFRLGQDDFNPRDGASPKWPIDLQDLYPWYEGVERLIGLKGRHDGLSYLPDSVITTELVPTKAEEELASRLKERWPNIHPVLGRYAQPFDSISCALATGNTTLQTGAIARNIDVSSSGQVQRVHWIEAATGAQRSTSAPIVFLCASALESTRILLLSSTAGGRPIARASGQLGLNLMDHVMIKAEGRGRGLSGEPVALEDGRCIYLPRFDHRDREKVEAGRGFGVQVYQVSGPVGTSYFTAVAFSEMLPRPDNRVEIDPARNDRWGIPVLKIHCRHAPEELDLAQRQAEALREIARVVDADIGVLSDIPAEPGMAVHECGTARMGHSPDDSVLNGQNECWDVKGLFVTDSACFPSQGSQNPTLTVMALTARAAHYAIQH